MGRTAIAAGDVSVKVLADNDICGQLAPVARNLAVDLLKDGSAALILDLCGTKLPVDLVERVDPSVLKTRGTAIPRRLRPRSLLPSQVASPLSVATTIPACSLTVAMSTLHPAPTLSLAKEPAKPQV